MFFYSLQSFKEDLFFFFFFLCPCLVSLHQSLPWEKLSDGGEAEHATNISSHGSSEKIVLTAKTMETNVLSASVHRTRLVQIIFIYEWDGK